MGMGSGLAIGAALAAPGRPVVCVTGDGAAGFALGEFEAMVRHRLAITVVVMNNARWGASQGFQLRPGGPQRVVGTSLSDADYHAVMSALGGHGVRVDTIDGLRSALAATIASRGPACINVSTYDVGVAPEIPLLNA
jgi:acetolactate synthase I/II/III large subunit